MTTPPEKEVPNPERAIAALAWAADVGTAVRDLAEAPPKPSPADHRAVSLEDARTHMDRLLMGKNTEDGLEALHMTGALDVWMPEVAGLVGFGDGEWRHKDVWKHTKQVVWQSVPRIEVRWGALLHDIGKPKTRRIEPNGDVHFHGHSEVGAAMFRKRMGERLGFDASLYDRVHYLILNHLRASQYEPGWTDAAVRRFAKEMDCGLTDLLDLSRADITTKRPEKKKRGLQQISDLAARIRELQEQDAYVPPLPKGVGNALMEYFKLAPGRRIGDLKRQLEDCVEDGEIEGGLTSEEYVAWVETNREKFGL